MSTGPAAKRAAALAATQQAMQALQALVMAGGAARPLLVEGTGNVEERLAIYRNAYRGRLVEALRLNFPVLRLAMGDADFEAMAFAFIAAHPSRRRSIRWFGEHLETFLRAEPAWLPHPALLDLARLEWAMSLAFDAADDTPMTAEALRGLDAAAWPELRFRLHPSVHLLTLDWAVEPILAALTADESAEPEAPDERPHTTLVWRLGLGPRWRELGEDEAAALRAVQAGRLFAGLCEVLAEHVTADDAANRAVAMLGRWLAEGLILT